MARKKETDWKRLPDGIGEEIPHMHIDPNARHTEVKCLRGVWSYGPSIACREGVVQQVSYPAGKTAHWIFWHDEEWVVLEGKAELIYTVWQNRFTVEKTLQIEKDDAFLIPNGADVHIKVDSSGPLKIFTVVMPAPEYYKPSSVKAPDGTVLDLEL